MVLGFLGWFALQRHEEGARFYESRGYTRFVDEALIAPDDGARFLRADCTMPDQPLILYEEPTMPSAHTTEEWERRTRDLAYFVEHSYLSSDMREPSNFVITVSGTGCELRSIKRGLHRMRLPLTSKTTWSGRLLWRAANVCAFLTNQENGTRHVLEMSPPGVRADEAVVLPLSSTESVQGRLLRLGTRRHSDHQVADLRMFGSAPMLHVGDPHTDTRLLVSGIEQAVGSRLRLESGDLLRLEQYDGNALRRADELLVEIRDARVVSDLQFNDGRWHRRTLDEAGPFLSRLASSIAMAVERSELPADGATADVFVTLDADVQRAVQEKLVDWCIRRDGLTGAAQQPLPGASRRKAPFRAAITVMDARTGAVLALASYPDAETYDTLLQRLEVTARSVAADEARRIRFRAREIAEHRRRGRDDLNVQNHQIGSVNKPLFAACLLNDPDWRYLLDMEIPSVHPSGSDRSHPVLGLDVGYYTQFGHRSFGSTVDFGEFLQGSCNHYLMHLAVLALTEHQDGRPIAASGAPPIPPEERVVGVPLVRLPDLGRYVDPEGEVPEASSPVVQLASRPVFAEYERLFGVGVLLEEGQPAIRYDERFVTPLLSWIGQGTPRDGSIFRGVMPTETWLAPNLMRRLDQDYIQFIKGAGNCRWNNLRIAEAFSRLATGQQVCAHFVDRVGPYAAAISVEDLPLESGVRLAILDGLSRVIQSGGTASSSRPTSLRVALEGLQATDPDHVYRLYSKTGSTERPTGYRYLDADGHVRSGGDPEAEGANYVLSVVRHDRQAFQEEGAAAPVVDGLTIAIFVQDQGKSPVAVALAEEVLPLLLERWP